MKKITLAATTLITLSSLGFAGSVSATELPEAKELPVTVTEGEASLVFDTEATTKSFAFDFSTLELSKGTTFSDTLNVKATLTNKTFKPVTGYIQATAQGNGLTVSRQGEEGVAVISGEAANVSTEDIVGDFDVLLNAKEVSSKDGYSITLKATDVDPVKPPVQD